MKMDCDTYQEQMSLWLDSQLTQSEVQRIEAHTATCPTCRATLDALSRVDRLLTLAPMMAPAPDFTARFQTRLVARRRRRRTWVGLLILTLATLAILLVPMILLASSGVALWESISASGLLTQVIALLLDLGKVLVASLKLVWLVVSALAQGLRHPIFVIYVIATATLVVVWTQIITRRALARRPVAVNL
jgi:predicted anti-sigma-YlaC factor YlaD